MEPKFHLGVVVRFKSEAFARTNGLLLAGPFSIAEIASHRIHPLFKLLKLSQEEVIDQFSYKLTDKNGDVVRIKGLSSGQLTDNCWFGESFLIPASLH